MSTAVQYQPPSRDELAREIRTYAPAMCLYRAGAEWFRMEIGGRDFHMPPHLPGEPMIEHPVLVDKTGARAGLPTMVPADGKIAIRDIYGILRDPKNRNQPTGIGLLTGMDAGSIVIFAVDTYREAGVVYLRGDESDGVRVEASRKLYFQHKLGWAKHEKDARDAFVKRFQETNKGAIPPPPTANQIRAQEILDEASLSRRSGATHICQVCYGWEGDSFAKYATHMRAAHGREIKSPEQETAETHEAAPRGSAINTSELEALVPEGTVEGAVESAPAIAQASEDVEALKRRMRGSKAKAQS